jgi:hypothetical protein
MIAVRTAVRYRRYRRIGHAHHRGTEDRAGIAGRWAAPALAELLAAKFEATAVVTRDAAFRDFQAEMKAFRADVTAEFNAFRADVTAEFKAFRADVTAEFKDLRADVDLRFAKMEARIAEARASQETSMRVLMAALIAALGVAVAIIKLFPNFH